MSIADNAQALALLIDGQDAPTAATRTVRDVLEERADEFARTESRNTGKPLKFSSAFDVPLTIDNLRFFAAAARNLEGKASAEYLDGLTSMELGGKAPFVVFDDADLEAAAEGAIVGAFANCGQDCTAATRIYVHDRVRDALMERLLHKVDRLVVGDPLDDATNLGPLISPEQRERVHGFVERALAAGTVWINEHLAIGSEMPHGGVKGSGFGKDMSMYALEEYTTVKHVVFELTGAPRKEWYDAVSTSE